MSNTKKTLEYLFISKVRIKVLKYFLFHPDVPIHLRGAVRELDEEINAVRRELQRLTDTNILHSERRGNRKYFTLNLKHPFFPELLAMMHKSYGLGGELLRNIKKYGEVDFVMLTSAFTRGISIGEHDVDLVIIGQVDLDMLADMITRTEKKLKREINYTVLKRSEFDVRKKRKDTFVLELLLGDNILLVGNLEDWAS